MILVSRAEDGRDPAEVSLLLAAICVGVLFLGTIGAPPAQAGGRVLTTSDIVRIRVLGQPDLDTTTRVEPDGTINFPYVGRIKAAGRTEEQLGRAIESRLVELQILANP
jgi:protein involved in polysaccharide export with SLBB domain